MSYCFVNCTVPACTNYDKHGKSNCVSGLLDAVNPERELTLYYRTGHTPGIVEGHTCDKGAMYARRSSSHNGLNFRPNLGTTSTDKTVAILVRHEVPPTHFVQNYVEDVELDNQPDLGGIEARVIDQFNAFRLWR